MTKRVTPLKQKPQVAQAPKKSEPVYLDGSDLQMLTDAMTRMSEAQAVWNFVQGQIAKKYQLGEGDQLDPHSGMITRA